MKSVRNRFLFYILLTLAMLLLAVDQSDQDIEVLVLHLALPLGFDIVHLQDLLKINVRIMVHMYILLLVLSTMQEL